MTRAPELARLLAAGVNDSTARLLADAVQSGGLVVAGAHSAAESRRKVRRQTLARTRHRGANT